MTEYSRSAKGSFASTGAAQQILLPFQPTRVTMWNYTAAATPTVHGVPWAWWDVIMGQGTAVEQVVQATTLALTPDVVTAGGISTFGGALALLLGPKMQIASTTKATNTVTTASAHGLSTGNVVMLEGLYQSSTTGMAQISGMPFVITVTGTTTFTINWNLNQSSFTALSGSQPGAYVQQVLNPYLYQPGVCFISAITTGSTTTVTTTTANNFVVGQEIGFYIPSAYGTTGLNDLPNSVIPGSPVYAYVTSISSPTQFVCSANSTGFTAFNSNQPITSVKTGLQFPQVFAVGDVNTGGTPYSGGPLYPPPIINGVNTINGPAISGAFVNNTMQGFIIGAGAGATDTSSVLVGGSGNVIYWQAFIDDISSP